MSSEETRGSLNVDSNQELGSTNATTIEKMKDECKQCDDSQEMDGLQEKKIADPDQEKTLNSCGNQNNCASTSQASANLCDLTEKVDFKVIYNKKKYDVNFPLDEKIKALKEHLQGLTELPSPMQKLVFKGIAKDDKTLREVGINGGAKVMLGMSSSGD